MNDTDAHFEGEIVLDGKRQTPSYTNVTITVFQITCCTIGIPLNSLLAYAIIRVNRLRSKSRNIFLLGLIMSNLISFIPALIKVAYTYSLNDQICQIYVAVVGLPYVLFMSLLLLALADRYVAIVHPLWHLKNVTASYVIVSQIGASLFVSVVYKFLYIIQYIPLGCELHVLQVNVIAAMLLTLYFSCLAAQFLVYRHTKTILASYTDRMPATKVIPSKNLQCASVNSTEAQHRNMECNLDLGRYEGNQEPTTTPSNEFKLCSTLTNHAVNEMEVEAIRTAIASATSLTIMTGPYMLFNLTILVCRLCYDIQFCSSISWVAYYLKELIVLHAVYHPLMYLLRSNELSSVLRQQWLSR